MAQDFDTILTAYQAKLDEIVAAVESSNWAAAYAKVISAKLIRAKIIESEIADQGSTLRNSDDLLKNMEASIAAAESSASKHSGTSRFAYAFNGYGAGGNR